MSEESSADRRPLEARPPPAMHATPGDLPARRDEPMVWWKPSWRDGARFVGYRWIFLTPALLLIAFFVGGLFFWPIRGPLLFVGAKLAIFVVTVTVSLAGWVFGRATKARSEPFCIHCGYNLSGLPDNHRCPECGRPYSWRTIDEYRRDPKWFIERWEMRKFQPPPSTPFEAGSALPRERSRDGTS